MARHPSRGFLFLFLAASSVGTALLVALWSWHPVPAWLVAANAVALPLWTRERRRAVRGTSRVPEAALHWTAVLGASPAALVSMLLVRGGSRRATFALLYLMLLVLQVGAFGWGLSVVR